MKKKSLIVSVAVAIVLTIGLVIMVNKGSTPQSESPLSVSEKPSPLSPIASPVVSKVPTKNVSISDGKQIVEITVSNEGGYFPRISQAVADMPTVVKLVTNHTFGCASTVVIPSLDFQETLVQTGTKEVSLPTQVSGTKLQGVCGMGMYNFLINFD